MGFCSGGKCAKRFLFGFNFLLWVSGLILVCVGLWLMLDPRRNFLLDLMHITQGDPLLRIAVYMMVGLGGLSVIVGLWGCCATVKEVPCLLCSYSLFLLLLVIGNVVSGSLANTFQNKMKVELQERMYNWTHFEYGRLYWVNDLVDRVQYWRECCGSNGPEDYASSWYQIHKSAGRPLQVPLSCCLQTTESWFDQLKAVDQEVCQIFPEIVDGKPNIARHNQGCYKSLLNQLNANSAIVIVLTFAIAAFQVLGIILSIVLCRCTSRSL